MQQASLTHVSGSARGVGFATWVDAPLSIRCAPKFSFARCAEATGISDAEVRTARRMLNALVFMILFGCRFDEHFDTALYFVTHRLGRKPLKKWIIFPPLWDLLKKSIDPVSCYKVYGYPMKREVTPTWTRAALAKKAGVGPETLRFYEQKGLLQTPRRNDSGYRIYKDEDLTRLQFIRRSQELGFSLSDIKQLLQLTGNIRTSRQKVRTFAEARLALIRQKIRDLRAMERALGSLVTQCDGKGALQGCPIVEFLGGETLETKENTHCHE